MHEIIYSGFRCFSVKWNIRYQAVSAYCKHLTQGEYCSDPVLTLIMN